MQSKQEFARVAVVGAGIMGSGTAQLAATAGHVPSRAEVTHLTLGERFRPTVGLRNLVAAGRLGCKTGRGIYDYNERGAIRLLSPS